MTQKPFQHGADTSEEVARLEDEIAALTQAIERNPGDSQAHFQRGLILGQLGEHVKAIKDFTAVVRLDPHNAEAYYNRGIARIQSKEHILAVDDFTETVRHSPGHADAYNNRAAAFYEMGRTDEAARDARKVLEINPLHPAAHAILALTYAGQGHDAAAEASAAQAEQHGFSGRTLRLMMRQERQRKRPGG